MSITYKPPKIWKQFYTALIRPHLEYAVQVWRPTQNGDIFRLEKIQKRALRIPYQLRGLTYEERLETLELINLETRRLNGIEQVRHERLQKLVPSKISTGPASCTRGNSQKLHRQQFGARIKNDFGSAVDSKHIFFSNECPLSGIVYLMK